jgi:hypothetical protein
MLSNLCFARVSSFSPYLRSPFSHECLSAEETVLCQKVEFVRSVINRNYCAVCILLIYSSSDIVTRCNKDDRGNNNNKKKKKKKKKKKTTKQIHIFGSL